MKPRDTRLFRRSLWLGIGAGLGLWLGRSAILPAAIHHAHISTISGHQPVYAMVGWTYGPGARPISVIFDIELAGGAYGSVTADGEALEAEVPVIGAGDPGLYRITASATYRILGIVRTIVYRFEGDTGRA